MIDRQESYSIQNSAQISAVVDPFTVERYSQFSKHLRTSFVDILDVGCAEGKGGAHLKGLLPDIRLVGLDCVESRLAKLPDAYSSSVCGLTEHIPLPDQSMDAVLAGEFIEHLYPSDVDRALCEFQRVLRVGGLVLLTTPNPYSLKMRFKRESVYSVSHLTQHFPEALVFRLKLHGFSHIRLLGSGRATRYFGEHIPFLSLYGSYLTLASKQ